ncbi:MAG: VOC family protein [Rhodanobacter sp.]|jgi:hypothetical protein
MKIHYRLLTMVLLGLLATALSKGVDAAAFQDNDYVRIDVPNMTQGVRFFRDVLACQPINPSAITGRGATPHASSLMSCGSDSIVELVASPASAHASNHGTRPVRLMANHLAGADRWLRRKGVLVIGPPRTRAGETVVNFITPWGLRMQLVSWQTDVTTAGP